VTVFGMHGHNDDMRAVALPQLAGIGPFKGHLVSLPRCEAAMLGREQRGEAATFRPLIPQHDPARQR